MANEIPNASSGSNEANSAAIVVGDPGFDQAMFDVNLFDAAKQIIGSSGTNETKN